MEGGEGPAVAGLLAFAARHSPYYRDQPWAARLRAGGAVRLGGLPLTPKEAVKERAQQFYSDFVPAAEGRVVEKFTSGSTGVALRVLKSQRHFAVNSRENERLNRGWGVGEHAQVIHTSYAEQGHAPGEVVESRMPDGSRHSRIYTFASRPVADLLVRTGASHFNSRPSVIQGVLQEDHDFSFLRLITTTSEIITPELRVLIAQLPACRHMDSYGSVETGILAVQCALCGEYHAAGGHAVIEVIDGNGKPAPPGAMGRVVVTPLFNLAMPLIRYDLGDYVQLSAGGRCRKPGQAFTRIIGRERNLFKLPGGGVVTPNVPPEDILAAGIRQYKLVQRKLAEVEFLYVPMSAATPVSAEEIQRLVAAHLAPGIRALPHQVEAMPISPGGKFLMHESYL